MPERAPRHWLAWLGMAAVIVVLDQFVKQLVLGSLSFGERVPVTGFFELVLVYNPGAAFSFLADQPGWQRWFFIALALVVCVWLSVLLQQHQHERLMPTAISLVIGGAIGNVIDRMLHGAVVDYLHFFIGRYSWPAFNLADAAITLGVGLMLVASFRAQPAHAGESP